MQPVFKFDAATVLSKGRRDYQEDAIVTDFSSGAEMGVAVLADGMGGHSAGNVASKIVVTEVFSELMFRRNDMEHLRENITGVLRDAAMSANACLREHVKAHPETEGMGATLVSPVIIGAELHWISIGDSPLFLFRESVLTQLNEDHSMAPQIDFLVKSGMIPPEEAIKHPDRNTLTSVLFGDQVAKIDCPDEPVELQHDDILIVASDGIQFLCDAEITRVLRQYNHLASSNLADTLLSELEKLEDPDLDNVSFTIIKLKTIDTSESDSKSHIRKGLRCVG